MEETDSEPPIKRHFNTKAADRRIAVLKSREYLITNIIEDMKKKIVIYLPHISGELETGLEEEFDKKKFDSAANHIESARQKNAIAQSLLNEIYREAMFLSKKITVERVKNKLAGKDPDAHKKPPRKKSPSP